LPLTFSELLFGFTLKRIRLHEKGYRKQLVKELLQGNRTYGRKPLEEGSLQTIEPSQRLKQAGVSIVMRQYWLAAQSVK
jgi:hypothetical protein